MRVGGGARADEGEVEAFAVEGDEQLLLARVVEEKGGDGRFLAVMARQVLPDDQIAVLPGHARR